MKLNVLNRCFGFTFVELMATIAILGFTLAIGIPSFLTLINNNRVSSQINNFVTSLNIARSEAVKRGADINVTAGGGGWTDGWTVTIAADGTVLRTQSALQNDSTLVEAGGTTSITFDSSGFLASGNSFTFNLCNTKTDRDKQVTITPGGRVNMVPDHDCGD